MNYKKTNALIGWIIFGISVIVYAITLEPTASWWDCGEFIATSYKLMVGHPPGSPTYNMLVRFLTFFSFGNVENVAYIVNLFSAFSTAAASLFLFWTATILTKKIVAPKQTEPSLFDKTMIFGASFIGALTCTFADSIWFSAVEAEVYGFTLFITAISFWAILKWEENYGKPKNDKWILFIFFATGLAIGVHLLNLLILPSICFVYVIKRRGFNISSLIISLISSSILVGFFYILMFSGYFKIMSAFELFFVNSLGLPFNSGAWFILFLTLGIIAFGVWYSHKKRNYILNLVVLSFFFFFLGYSSFYEILFRAQANVTINESPPNSPMNMVSYLDRDQYGSRDPIWGSQFNTPVKEIKKGQVIYAKVDGKYVPVSNKTKVIFDGKKKYLFPRMFGREEQDIQRYERWIGEKIDRKKGPTFAQNLKYIFVHQLGFMNFRYFMWNFSGRQNDRQSLGSAADGNWISGLSIFDSGRVGSSENMPPSLSQKASRNIFYMLPFLLGLLGLFFHLSRDKEGFTAVMSFFMFTGPILTVFGIMFVALEPRERDYVYGGEIYSYCIWIAIGVVSLVESFRKIIKNPSIVISGVLILSFLAVPFNMAANGWDDHDRSGRTLTRDIARNYLASCPKDAILITFGDNDTFPLWYVQEVEGFRRDVKVLVTSYLNTGWYIDQARRATYEAKKTEMTMDPMSYIGEKRTQTYVLDRIKEPVELSTLVKFATSDDADKKLPLRSGEAINYFPASTVRVSFDRKELIEKGIVEAKDTAKLGNFIEWKINRQNLYKGELAVYDMIVTNKFRRPICLTSTGNKLGVNEYLSQEGLVYRLLPYKPRPSDGKQYEFDVEKNYSLLMENISFDNNLTGIHFDWENQKFHLISDINSRYIRLARNLANQGDLERAKKVLEKAEQVFDVNIIEIPSQFMEIGFSYYDIGEDEKGKKLLKKLWDRVDAETQYYLSLREDVIRNGLLSKIQNSLVVEQAITRKMETKDSTFFKAIEPIMEKNSRAFFQLRGQTKQ